MSGHNKWSTIKFKKGAADAKRGKIFTKIIKEVTLAARLGGGDVDANPRLRTASDKAKAANMPKENMERAIKKGTGELEGVAYEEMVYEGYGSASVAIIMDITTDNKNRTAAEIRSILSKRGGSLGSTNCVGWMFEKKGLIFINSEDAEEEVLMELVLEAGAEDMTVEEDGFEIITSLDSFGDIVATLQKAEITIASAETTRIQTSGEPVNIDNPEKAEKVIALLQELEDHDDVSSISSNFVYSG